MSSHEDKDFNELDPLVGWPFDANIPVQLPGGPFRRVALGTFRKNNYALGADPTVNTDSTLGFAFGSVVGHNGLLFVCMDPEAGNASWDRFALLSKVQTLFNKTLHEPVFSGDYTFGGNPTFPSSIATLTGTQTLENKTLAAPAMSGTITGTYTLGGSPTFPSSVVITNGTQTLTNKTITSPAMSGTWTGSPTFSGLPSLTGGVRVGTTSQHSSYKITCEDSNGSQMAFRRGTGIVDMFQGGTTQGGAAWHIRAGGSGGVVLDSGATSWGVSSDERLKTDLEPIDDAIERMKMLVAGVGRYLSDPEGTRRAFISAQSAQLAQPEAVGEGEDGYLNLRQQELMPLMIVTIQKLIDRVEELENAS